MKKIIVLTGPESTAKSTLTKALAAHFDAAWFPEYAREYLADKGHNYTYDDVEKIARTQLHQYESLNDLPEEIVFFDTWLIITKIWFEWVFKRVPSWLEDAISSCRVDLFLLCRPDIPWEPDPLRENGGDERIQLFNRYKQELISRNLRFVEVGGLGDDRLFQAIEAVQNEIFHFHSH